MPAGAHMAPGGTAFPLSGHTTRHRTWPVTHARAALPGQIAAFLQRRPRLRRPGRRGHGDATYLSGCNGRSCAEGASNRTG
jgi:hypothetical protein